MAIRKVIPRSLDSAAASANLSFDANTLFVDSTNNVVGINTATPNSFATGLAVYNATNPSVAIVSGNANAYLRLYSTSDSDMYLSNTAGKMTFTTAATARMTINSSGNVGIGTTSPNAALELSRESADVGLFITRTGSGAADYRHFIDGGGDIRFTMVSSYNMRFFTANTERMRIDSSGNLLVGTTSLPSGGGILTASSSAAETKVSIDNTGTSGRHYWLGSSNTSSGALGAGKFAIFDQTANAARLVIDSSGNVGIGTSSPSSRLHTVTSSGENKLSVEATAASQSAVVSLITNATTPGQCILYMGKSGATTNGQVGYDPNSNFLYLYTNNSERMRITSTGRVGVGVSDPQTNLEVAAATDPISLINATTLAQGNRAALMMAARNVNGNTGNVSIEAISVNNQQNDMVFRTGATTMTAFGTERMRIDTSGNVGIGTTSPSTFANGMGPVLATGVFPNFATVQGRTDGPSGATNSVSYGGSYQANPINGARMLVGAAGSAGQRGIITFCTKDLDDNTTQPLERMRITSAGKVGVATTSPSGDFAMTVADTGFCATRINIGNVAGYLDGNTIICGSDFVDPTTWVSNAAYRFGASRQGVIASINPSGYTYEGGSGGGSRTFAVNSNGNVQNSNNSYGSLSDEKLKENIVDATPKLQSLMQVKIRNFNLIADEAKTKQLGVIAQELEEVFPSMIDEHIDYTLEPYIREDGIPDSKAIPTGTTTKEVKYSVFVPMLIKAIQEQQVLIAQLQADVAALQAK